MCATNENIAIIDVGSNSVRLRISKNDAVFLRERVTTQLARGSANGVLNESSVERTFNGLDKLFAIATKHKARIFAFATAAVRNAKQSDDFCQKFFKRYGVKLHVLSGEEEAEMGILGALDGNDGCVIDVGGASSELIIAQNKKIIYAYSMQLGAVSLTDICGKDFNFAMKTVNERLKEFPPMPSEIGNVFCIGGTSNNVAFIMSKEPVFDRDKTSGYNLKVENLKPLVEKFYSLTPSEIIENYKIGEIRAKVIHSGALILYSLFKFINAQTAIMSENDNLEGYYLAKIKGKRYEK